jgi:hypothetical protein
MTKPNAQYNEAPPGGIVDRVSLYQRRRIYSHYRSVIDIADDDTLLDVGATADDGYDHSNYVLAWTDNPSRMTACGVDPAESLEKRFPGLKYVKGDGCDLPFADNSFDHVHSSAVLEHVGDFSRQVALIRECARVARKSIYLTTPDPRFLIEFHTALPLVHWLPKPLFRNILTMLNKDFFADESHLNLMRPAELRAAARAAVEQSHKVTSLRLLAWPANQVCYANFDPS